MATVEEIGSLLSHYISESPRVYSTPWMGAGIAWAGPRPTVEELAQELLAVAEEQAMELADWLQTPEGEVLAAGVALVVPEYYATDYRLFVDALHLASGAQQRVGRKRAGLFVLGVAGVFLFAILFGE